jgi:uncharacterized protein YggU (UPF0235/DUF167 family)
MRNNAPATGRFVTVRVRPRSTRAGVERGAGKQIVIGVHAPPAGNAANRECEATVAKALGLRRSAVRIVRGHRSRDKQIAVSGLSSAEARARLEEAAGRESS